MRQKQVSIRVILVLALTVMSLVAVVNPAFAQSSNCVNIVDGFTTSSAIGVTTSVPMAFEKGDHITVTITNPQGGASALEYYVDSNLEDTGSVPGTFSSTIPADGSYLIQWLLDTGTANFSFTCDYAALVAFIAALERGEGPPALNLFDGRINDTQGKDVAAPVAIYPGSIQVYGINPADGSGHQFIYLSDADIEAAGIPSDAPILLAEATNTFTGMGIAVYRLPDGNFQVNAQYENGQPYVYVWDDNGNGYHLPG